MMALEESPDLPPEYDTLHTGIGLYDPMRGTLVNANERLETLLGYTTDQLRGLSMSRYTANTYEFSEAEFVTRLREAFEGHVHQFIWRVKRSDGTLLWVRINLSRQTGDGHEYVVAEFRDVTDYYTASRRETLFWRILRHNLRNETTTIVGHAGEIQRATDSDEVLESAAVIQSTAMELGNVATSVKEIQQAATQSDTDRVYRQAADAVRDVVADIEPDYPDAEITVDERESMWVHVDAAFTHALDHAIENALIHGEQSPPTVEITVGPSPNTGRVEIRIADTNPPIPESEIAALDEFADITSTSHGTGVGLFVMKWCIESLGGELEFERRDPGNLVRLYLPPKERPDHAI
jgi:PAS domain S-box-containing protein